MACSLVTINIISAHFKYTKYQIRCAQVIDLK
jgi:hypothetical protein